MIQTDNLSYKAGARYLVKDVSLDVQPGTLHLIIGANGAGKSTLIKLMSGQLQPSAGSVSYAGKTLAGYSFAQMACIRAVLSQSLEFSFPMKVDEVVMMGRYPHFTGSPKSKDLDACASAMDYFNVTDLANRDYATLSGGEKQRVHFARVLAQIWYPTPNQYRYLFLDEPLTFLDVHYQHQFMQHVKDLLKMNDLVVLGVVHDLNLAAKFADKITLLNEGQVFATGNSTDVLTAKNLETIFHTTPDIISHKGTSYIFF